MKRVLIVRMSAIGDVVFASPLIEAIKKDYPDAKIFWLAEPIVKDLLRCDTDIEEVIEFPKNRFKQLWKDKKIITLFKELSYFSKKLKSYNFDTAIDAQGLLKSAIIAWFSGAPVRYGFKSKEFSHLFLNKVTDKGGNSQHISSEYYHLIRFMGLDNSVSLSLKLCSKAYDNADILIKTYDLNNGFIALTPFTTRPQKHWFHDSWKKLIHMLQSYFNLPIIILGSEADKESAQYITQGTSAINLAGKTKIDEAAALLKKSLLIIGVDTGLTHMAVAQMRPTIALFGATVPYTKTDNPYVKVIYHKFECSPCRRRPICANRFDCMQAISPEEVVETAKSLIKVNI
ncbi:lipopolysaccharide heptosyltransferase II [Hydrogenimonas thermophila]|uniref:lipopolysaccharide heptosyltransferase II n=1 Tax=Hydrogenimonas thermophila TaxID=223786 RepID=A0A1I5U3Q0_9BACT|nr:lipopolysaccharide heptosyltransferase II [Hydrogenimonas thermophila]SFP89922.1 heptosyltransferase-1 [Hydrogenimonas thermophila]